MQIPNSPFRFGDSALIEVITGDAFRLAVAKRAELRVEAISFLGKALDLQKAVVAGQQLRHAGDRGAFVALDVDLEKDPLIRAIEQIVESGHRDGVGAGGIDARL